MRIDRDQVVRALAERGLTQQAARAQRELDTVVDTRADAELRTELGIEPGERGQGGVPGVRRTSPEVPGPS